MVTAFTPEDLYGAEVRTVDGGKLGKIDEVYLDDETGRPDWAKVKGGLLGHRTSLVPVANVARTEDRIELPYDEQRVKDAPQVDMGDHLDAAEEAQLFAYYGIPYTGASMTAVDAGVAPPESVPPAEPMVATDAVPPAGAPAPAPAPAVPADGSDAMTRSEEELRVGTRQTESGRARLHKYVTTEHVQQSVPVRHEEVRVEREPITDANVDAATSGPDIAVREHEVVLHEEEPVVEKRTVPKERVRLATEEMTEQVPVEAELRKERIEEEGDAG